MFELARDLNMTAGRLNAEVDFEEFAQWRELYRLEAEEKQLEWSQTDELLASLIEVNDSWFRGLATLLGAKKSSLGKPVQVARPGTRLKQQRTFAEDLAMAGGFLDPSPSRRYFMKKGGE